MTNEPRKLQVLITAGAEDPHKARQGLEAALTACDRVWDKLKGVGPQYNR